MSLLKTKPTIELFVPRTLSPGGRLEAEVRLHAKEDVEVEHLHVDLTCQAGWSIGSGKHQVSRREDLLKLRAVPFAGPILRQGDHSFRAGFQIPPELPPAYAGGAAYVRWVVSIEVSIPWWPDARSHHPLAFALPDAPGHQSVPSTYRQHASEANAGAPRIEASLTSSTLAPGGRVAGAIALYNYDPSSTFPIRVGLVERNRLFSRRRNEYQRSGRSWFVKVESPAGRHQEGTTFEFLVPPEVTPTFRCEPFRHDYSLEIEVKTGLLSSSTLSIPVTIVSDSRLKDQSMRLAAPSVGASRMAELGREVAARRGYVIDGGVLTRTVSVGDVEVDLEVRHESRADEGTFLVGALSFPRLGLGLAVEPQTGIAGYFARDVEIGHRDHPAWDRQHRVSARDPAQAIGFLREVVERLGLEAAFAELTDDGARIEQADPQLSAQSLDEFAAKVERVAMALGESSPLVLPPTGIEPGLEWRTLAARLGARLVVGDLGIDEGRLGGAEVSIETKWENGPAHRIELTPDPPLPEEVSFFLARPRTDADTTEGPSAERLSPEVRAVLARLPEDAANLQLQGGKMSVELPFDLGGEKPRARPAELSTVIDLLARLGPLFGVRRGPFR